MLSIPRGNNKWRAFAIGELSLSFTAHFAVGGLDKGAILFVISVRRVCLSGVFCAPKDDSRSDHIDQTFFVSVLV